MYLFGPLTVNCNFRNFTCNRGHTLQSFHGWTWTCVCMCVKFNYLTMDYPLPQRKSIIGLFFFFTCMPRQFANEWQFLEIMDVHGWCVPKVIWQFFWFCPWLKVQMHTHTHTCTNTHTHTHTHITRTFTHTHTHTHNLGHSDTHTHTHTNLDIHLSVRVFLWVNDRYASLWHL